MLINLLVAFGSVVGDRAHCVIDSNSKHPCRLFVCLVGKSAKSRKRTSWTPIEALFKLIDDDWKVQGGLTSGEGVSWHVRNKVVEYDENDKEIVKDKGVDDKRLMLVEEEFSSVLQSMARDKNILSETIRKAWDTGNLQSLTKHNSTIATGAHICIIGNMVEDELAVRLGNTESYNGFANRILWWCTKRSKELSRGGHGFNIMNETQLVRQLHEAVEFAKNTDEVKMADDTWKIWDYIYHDLTAEQPGLLGALTGRKETYIRRIAIIYALIDKSSVVLPVHLLAALAVIDYEEASVKYIFQGKLGDPIADKILYALKQNPGGLTLRQISTDVFHNDRDHISINKSLHNLLEQKIVTKTVSSTAGRPATLITLNSFNSLNFRNKTNSFLHKAKTFVDTNCINYKNNTNEINELSKNNGDNILNTNELNELSTEDVSKSEKAADLPQAETNTHTTKETTVDQTTIELNNDDKFDSLI